MKTNPARLPAATVLFAVIMSVFAADAANAPRIDPATGQPVAHAANVPHLDPTTGQPVLTPDVSALDTAVLPACIMDEKVRGLIANGQYDEALQQCLSFQRQLTGNHTLIPLIPSWVELGRRFPKAREALIEVRDNYQREFSKGRGYSHLFSELSAINGNLNQEDATCALFKSIGHQDKKLAQECYGIAQPVLIQRGEFNLCMSYIGDPQAQFDSFQQAFARQGDNIRRMTEMKQRTAPKIAQANAELNQKLGIPNSMLPPVIDTAATAKMFAQNGFVGQTCQLIEILVGLGRKADAEKIRDQALAVLDDPRLKSAVSDAETKTRK